MVIQNQNQPQARECAPHKCEVVESNLEPSSQDEASEDQSEKENIAKKEK